MNIKAKHIFIQEMEPIAYILRKTKRSYTVRCPFCKSQHQHGVVGDLDGRGAHCVDEPWMSRREKYNMKIAKTIYRDTRMYDLAYPPEDYKDSLYNNTYVGGGKY